MYQVWSNFLNPGQIAMLGIVVTFLLTFLALKHPFPFCRAITAENLP